MHCTTVWQNKIDMRLLYLGFPKNIFILVRTGIGLNLLPNMIKHNVVCGATKKVFAVLTFQTKVEKVKNAKHHCILHSFGGKDSI